jgi:hypothetical protein
MFKKFQYLGTPPIKRNYVYKETGRINLKEFLFLFGWKSIVVMLSFRNFEYRDKSYKQ